MKKLRTDNPELLEILINKMLEKQGVDYDYVIKNKEIDGILWCSYYTWTQKEADEYKKWWINFFRNNVTPKLSKDRLEREWQWFLLMWGLKVEDEK